eukprot:scaffold202779_cov32-Prasinocladus_malaysianus.AAC.1
MLLIFAPGMFLYAPAGPGRDFASVPGASGRRPRRAKMPAFHPPPCRAGSGSTRGHRGPYTNPQ